MADGPSDGNHAGNDGRDDSGSGPRDRSGRPAPGDAGPREERESDAERPLDGTEDRDFESEPSLASVLGAERAEAGARELVPGSPSLENAAFVALGVLVTILVLYRAWTVFVG